MNPITADSPSMANAIAPTATPMLPPRNVQALMTPDPAPALEGGRLDRARRGAVAYGNALLDVVEQLSTATGLPVHDETHEVIVCALNTARSQAPARRLPMPEKPDPAAREQRRADAG